MACRKLLYRIIASVGVSATPAAAEEKALSIELNDAVDVDGGCRLAYVAMNGTGVLLDKTSFDVFTFDKQGKVGQSLVFQFGRLPAGKTKVVQFDLAGQSCATISRLLINDITECVAEGKNSTICIDALKTTARTSISFGL
ncbi:hypothetical protein MesoLjLc_53840 [Mesorhizobium sp. L-8-10]|uniref:hypothetical protein n=1 Tax=unclassified Mesorhizobium TaxID=325217 RepID=UPI001928A468|nr:MULTISPECIES: hypothetical protein [unclassified Mesorhizobium]BCH25453.1 hypothetical protein MesoLjLb_52380 [Mesorhizobium sp. L-8-3]BCH33454.1 hypothetical protein MesoLjLc_53840 [Mesorhizobium sp. L-8-10]